MRLSERALVAGAVFVLLVLALACDVRAATFQSTAYGGPWGGINGTGVTRTGIDLRAHPGARVVAVDPAVIPLGSLVTVWPNPWRTRRPFLAADTGGAIRGTRIDIYHPERAVQLAWGRRPVQVHRVVYATRSHVTQIRERPPRGVWALR